MHDDKPFWAENIGLDKLNSYLETTGRRRLALQRKMSSRIVKYVVFTNKGEFSGLTGDFLASFEVNNLVISEFSGEGNVIKEEKWSYFNSLKSYVTEATSNTLAELTITCQHTGFRWVLTLHEKTDPKGLHNKFVLAQSEAAEGSSQEFGSPSDSSD